MIKSESNKDRRLMDKGAAQAGYMGAAIVPAVAAGFIPGANTVVGAGLIGAAIGANIVLAVWAFVSRRGT
jgi:uncharacterized membrane protein YeaQ/YmgE (transglycosylase-associated protein family)